MRSSGFWSAGRDDVTSLILVMAHEAGQVAHMPSRRLTKDWGLNKGSNSPTCSPVPMKITGALVAATALGAPPPLISVAVHASW
jgi:hypothetical protein